MKKTLDPAQNQASDPCSSVWVSASAGTGKTKVLVDRLLRLLLRGVEPSHMVCLTFTHAAASEMQGRLYDTLGLWARMEEEDLQSSLEHVLGDAPSGEIIRSARGLLERVLSCPQGMRIQTLHHFCQALLMQFPLECGLDPDFQLLDEGTASALLDQALVQVLSGSHDADIQRAVRVIQGRIEPSSLRKMMKEVLHKRWVLGFLGQHTLESMHNAFAAFGQDPFVLPVDETALRHLSAALCLGSASEQKQGAVLQGWLEKGMPEKDPHYLNVFLKSNGEEVRLFRPTQKLLKQAPHVERLWHNEAERVMALKRQNDLRQVRQDSAALSFVAYRVIQVYEALKEKQHLLDYDDLIAYTISLLEASPQAPWVLQQATRRVHHLLIDEAQDTSPSQWKVIQSLIHELYSSAQEGLASKTLFVVGDFKQSIYSFQGADPYYFEAMRVWCRTLAETYQQPWREVSLTRSYRSGAFLIQWVREVFDRLQGQLEMPCLTLEPLEAFRHPAPSLVEVWPLVQAASQDDEEDEDSPAVLKLAQVITDRIKNWLETERFLEARGRSIHPGDILVLLQRRGGLMQALVQSLARAGIPSTGSDRFMFQENQAIQDLLMIARVALFPQDDLALACVLKGPWIGLSEEELCALCATRPAAHSLWDDMKEHLAEDHPIREALQRWRHWAGFMTPFQFFSTLLEQEKGRELLVQRLGSQTHEILDTFLQACLDFQQLHPPTLQHWLHFLETYPAEIQRDLHAAGHQVRLMSVHSAKGLQAPVVILADTHLEPRVRADVFWAGDTPPYQMVFAPRQRCDTDETASLRRHHRHQVFQESLRLLYVALTRAEDELHLVGLDKVGTHAWYPYCHKG